jgi:predicted neutral ceramidase superfamily lipid hydrolase
MNLKQILFLTFIFLIIWWSVYYFLADYLQRLDRKIFIFKAISYYRESTFWYGLLAAAGSIGYMIYKLNKETKN